MKTYTTQQAGLASESQTIGDNFNLTRRLLKYTAYENKFMSSLSLAESGFIPLDQEPSTDAVVCVWCCLTLRDFTEPVDAVAVHQSYSYDCEYLRVIVVKERRGSWQLDIYDMELEQPTAVSTNVENDSSTLFTTAVYSTTSPLVPDVTQLQEMSDLERYKLFVQDRYEKSTSVISRKLGVKRADSMKYESCRRETFTNTFFNEDEGSYMAASGLLWKKSCVACGFCNWRWNVTAEEDIPSAKDITEKHLNDTAGRNCQFNSGKNIPAVLEESVWQGKPPSAVVPRTAQLQLLGVNTHFSKHAEFAVIDRRVATFLTYPHENGQSCDELAEAGYYYAGNGDKVTCFSCGVVSSSWLTAEIPWQRHARSSPFCQYLAEMKETNFANQVIEQLGSYSTAEPENRINTITTRMIHPHMESPAVQGALARGLDRSKVRDVISRRIQRGENDFRYTAEIVKAVHDVDVPSTTHTDQPKLPSCERPERKERNTSDQTEEGAEALENVGMDQDEMNSRNDAIDATDEMRQTDAPRRTSGSTLAAEEPSGARGRMMNGQGMAATDRYNYLRSMNETSILNKLSGARLQNHPHLDSAVVRTLEAHGLLCRDEFVWCPGCLFAISLFEANQMTEGDIILSHSTADVRSVCAGKPPIDQMKRLRVPTHLSRGASYSVTDRRLDTSPAYSTANTSSMASSAQRSHGGFSFARLRSQPCDMNSRTAPSSLLAHSFTQLAEETRGSVQEEAMTESDNKFGPSDDVGNDANTAEVAEAPNADEEERDPMQILANVAHEEDLRSSDAPVNSDQEDRTHSQGEPVPVSRTDRELAIQGYRLMTSQLTCKTCRVEVVSIVFLPCGHLVCCATCAEGKQQCPVCRKDLTGTVKANIGNTNT